METLKPVEQVPFEMSEPAQAQPVTEAGMPLKHVEFLSELGLKDQLFNDKVMEKIAFLADNIDIDRLKELALTVGNDGWISKLDKIYTVVHLSRERDELVKKQSLINETLKKYA